MKAATSAESNITRAMMLQEYREYYSHFVVTTLGPAIERAALSNESLQEDPTRKAAYKNMMTGMIVLALVSLIESNFIGRADMKSLRKFEHAQARYPQAVNPSHLSGFIYIRDCFAHNPTGVLFPASEPNTKAFLSLVVSGSFQWAKISDRSISILPGATHELHHIVLRFFGETAGISP